MTLKSPKGWVSSVSVFITETKPKVEWVQILCT